MPNLVSKYQSTESRILKVDKLIVRAVVRVVTVALVAAADVVVVVVAAADVAVVVAYVVVGV